LQTNTSVQEERNDKDLVCKYCLKGFRYLLTSMVKTSIICCRLHICLSRFPQIFSLYFTVSYHRTVSASLYFFPTRVHLLTLPAFTVPLMPSTDTPGLLSILGLAYRNPTKPSLSSLNEVKATRQRWQ